jgi:hypothetical protein
MVARRGKGARKTQGRAAKPAGRRAPLPLLGVEPPAGGAAIASGAQVLVSLDRPVLRRVPEGMRSGEILLEIVLRTGTTGGGGRAVQRAFPVFLGVRPGEPLPIRDYVLFAGKVDHHLTLDIEITEVEAARRRITSLEDSGATLARAAGAFAGFPGAGLNALRLIPQTYAALLRANADDPILGMHLSLFASDVGNPTPGRLELREGRYRCSAPAGSAAGQEEISFSLDVAVLRSR